MVETREEQFDSRFEFRYQRDPAFYALLECGIGRELSSSGYCWAASTEMALSPFVPRPLRMQIVINAAQQMNQEPEAFGPKGNLNLNKLDRFVSAINIQLEKHKLDATMKLIEMPGPTNYHEELERGNTVIFAIGENPEKHVLTMDSFLEDGGVYHYSAWDPEHETPNEGRVFFNNLEIEQLPLYPLIISVGKRVKQN